MTPDRPIFVCGADTGIAAGLPDLVHNTVSPSTCQCSLCGVTYGTFGMKREWRGWLELVPCERAFHHRPDFRAAYPAFADRALPLVARDDGGTLTELLGADALARLSTLDLLIKALRDGLRLPA